MRVPFTTGLAEARLWIDDDAFEQRFPGHIGGVRPAGATTRPTFYGQPTASDRRHILTDPVMAQLWPKPDPPPAEPVSDPKRGRQAGAEIGVNGRT